MVTLGNILNKPVNSPALYVDVFLACFSQVAKVATNGTRRTGLHWHLGIVARFVIKVF